MARHSKRRMNDVVVENSRLIKRGMETQTTKGRTRFLAREFSVRAGEGSSLFKRVRASELGFLAAAGGVSIARRSELDAVGLFPRAHLQYYVYIVDGCCFWNAAALAPVEEGLGVTKHQSS
jgi:hypothetical protein